MPELLQTAGLRVRVLAESRCGRDFTGAIGTVESVDVDTPTDPIYVVRVAVGTHSLVDTYRLGQLIEEQEGGPNG